MKNNNETLKYFLPKPTTIIHYNSDQTFSLIDLAHITQGNHPGFDNLSEPDLRGYLLIELNHSPDYTNDLVDIAKSDGFVVG